MKNQLKSRMKGALDYRIIIIVLFILIALLILAGGAGGLGV